MLIHITQFIILVIMATSTITVIEGVTVRPTSAQSNNTVGDLSIS
jgi:hypothetical protein